MCGRFAGVNGSQISRAYGHDVGPDDWDDQDHYPPRYNIAPRTNALVLRRGSAGPSGSGANDNSLVRQMMKWGLVPHWSKFEDKSLKTINARAENLVEGGGLWGNIKGKKRCAVPCQGYYEWLTKGKDKIPHFIKHRDGQTMYLAGLYDCVTLEGQTEPLWTFTIVTTNANKDFSWLHDRQPVILSNKEVFDLWLDTRSQKWTPELSNLVQQPYNDTTAPLECYQVPKEVGKIGAESPSFILPISQRKDGIEAMFSKQKQLQSERDLKRKRSPTPTTPTPTPSSSDNVEASAVPPCVAASQLEEDDDLVILDAPPKKSKVQEIPDQSPVPKSPQKRKAVKSKPKKVDKGKITSFFTRAKNT